jgi:predicted dehydrogenase
MEFATHYFDLWRHLLSAEVEEIHATTKSDEWDDVTGTLTARLSNGALANAYFSEWTSDRNELHIYGRDGSLHLDLYRFDGLEFVPLHRAPGAMGSRASRFARSLKHLPRAVRYFRRGGEYYASFIAQWRHFAESIRQDTPPGCTLEDGSHALQVALAAAESTTTGRSVRMKHAPREITPYGEGTTG